MVLPPVRDALDALVRNGFEPRLILLADAAARSSSADESANDESAPGPSRPISAPTPRTRPKTISRRRATCGYEMTKLDRDFLRTVRIQPESG